MCSLSFDTSKKRTSLLHSIRVGQVFKVQTGRMLLSGLSCHTFMDEAVQLAACTWGGVFFLIDMRCGARGGRRAFGAWLTPSASVAATPKGRHARHVMRPVLLDTEGGGGHQQTPPPPSMRCPRTPQGRGLRPARREVPAKGVATGP